MHDNRKPRVLLLCTNSDLAGAPLHVEFLARELADKIDFVLVFGEDGPVSRRLLEDQFNVKVLKGMRSTISPVSDINSLQKILRLIDEWQPDLIHCHSSKAGMLGRVAGYFRKIPVVFTVHGWSWASVSGGKAKLIFFVEHFLARLKNVYFIYVSHAVETVGQKKLGLTNNQGVVIHNGVPDLSQSTRKNRDFVRFIMPARVAYPKDHETVIRAFDALEKESVLVLCGTGTDSSSFACSVEDWAPRRHRDVIRLGQRVDIPRLLHDSDAMILSSRSEALPLSIIEALSVGLPVIATDVGGVSELVATGQNGYLVEKGNVSTMIHAMESLLDPARRREMGVESRRRFVSGFTIQMMADATLSCYTKACGHSS